MTGGTAYQVDDLTELVHRIEGGEWQPRPGSVGAKLAEAFREPCAAHRSEALAGFARTAWLAEGWYWPMLLNANPALLSDEEAEAVAEAWRTWVVGGWPFRRGSG